MLYSTPSTRAIYEPPNLNQRPNDLSQSGSTIASIAFTNRNSFEKQGESTFELSLTDMQDLNSKANYEAYLRHTGEDSLGDTMNYSDTFESISGLTGSYNPPAEERKINSAGFYNLSTINEESSQCSDYSEKQELTQVVDLYKSQIEKTMKQESETVSSPLVSDRVIGGDKKSAMRKKCLDQMGQSTFEEIYKFLKQARDSDIQDEIIREQALKRWGKAANNYCLLVDQLLFLEWY